MEKDLFDCGETQTGLMVHVVKIYQMTREVAGAPWKAEG